MAAGSMVKGKATLTKGTSFKPPLLLIVHYNAGFRSRKGIGGQERDLVSVISPVTFCLVPEKYFLFELFVVYRNKEYSSYSIHKMAKEKLL